MPGSWTISVAGRTYGPFSDEQMQAFAAEGRLARQSLVARAGGAEFRRAADEPALAFIFSSAAPACEAVAQRLHREAPAGFGRNEDHSQSGEVSHFVIMADMKSGSIAKLEEEIATLGPVCAILPQVWLLKTEGSVNMVRNILVQQLGKLDVLFVADATHDKAAWFNFGPEVDARIRRIWRSEPKLQATG
jgi:hypothetical protein